jgi:hypothetical protein
MPLGIRNDSCKEVGLEVNAVKTKYVLLPHQNAGQHHDIKKANIYPLKMWLSSDIWE